jgi:D-arabinan exo alpha-(1,3)/(1,5)-arabinofuranosidase (non-reducing end)
MTDEWLWAISESSRRGDRSRSLSAENPDGAVGGGGRTSSMLGAGRKGAPFLTLPAGQTTTIADIDGAGTIAHIWMTLPAHTDEPGFVLRDLILRAYWDGSDEPAIETPLGDFFCNGNGQRSLVTSSQIVVAPTGGFNSYFAMPFSKGARITIENEHPKDVEGFFYSIDYLAHSDPQAVPPLRLHARWRRENPTTLGQDYTIVDGITGRGIYVGTSLTIVALERYWWGEGEMKFFIDDDDEFPTICGTGTEDYFGGAWAFQDRLSKEVEPQVLTFSAPYFGYPTYITRDDSQQAVYATSIMPVHGMYRWHIPDPIHFSTSLRVTIQQIGQVGSGLFERSDDVSSVAYWYQEAAAGAPSDMVSRQLRSPR